jgi:HPt (histidine-containing phosphotransfer) domain-containing protein
MYGVRMADTEYFDCYRLQEVLGSSDKSTLESFYVLYLEQLDELIALLNDHSLRKDYQRLGFIAHKYKSSSLNVGADLLAQTLGKIELSIDKFGDLIVDVDLDDVIRVCNETKDSVKRACNPSWEK